MEMELMKGKKTPPRAETSIRLHCHGTVCLICFICVPLYCSEAAKVPSEDINIKDGEKKKGNGDEPNAASASPSTPPAALTQ